MFKKIITKKAMNHEDQISSKEDVLEVDFYSWLYDDLKHFSNEELKNHYFSYGKKEGRYSNRSEFLAKDPSMQFAFDSDFYLSFYPDLKKAGIDDEVKAKWHWLTVGNSEKRFKKLDEWVKSQNVKKLYFDPSDINTKLVLQKNKDLGVTARDLVELSLGRIEKPIKIKESNEKNAAFYREISRKAVQDIQKIKKIDKKNLKLHVARTALKVSYHFDNCIDTLEELANTYIINGEYLSSISTLESALENFSELSLVGYKYLLDSYKVVGNLDSAFKCLELCISKNPEKSIFLEWLDELAELEYSRLQKRIEILTITDERKKIELVYKKFSSTIYNLYYNHYNPYNAEIELRKNLNKNKVLIVGDYHIPQCIRYRIDQKVEQLASQNINVSTIDWLDLKKNYNQLSLHDIVIFYRVPCVPSVIKSIAQLNASGKATFYEIDDLLFESIYPEKIESYGGYVDINTHVELRKSSGSFLSIANLCEFGIASTKPLQKKLEKQVRSSKCIVHRNGLDKLNYFKSKDFLSEKNIDIFYGSGTQAHNSDFIDQALPALSKILDERSNVRLIIVGYLELPEDFKDKFNKNIVFIPPVKSVKAYWSLLEKSDINLAILNDDAINGCKSELKWFEAACFDVPSVVSTTQNYRDVIQDGVDGYITSSSDDLFTKLSYLIDNPTVRKEIALQAKSRVQNEYSVEFLGKNLVENIYSLLPQDETHSKKKKIAIVNVFFPPQAIGGATRVVADNVDELVKNYGTDYEYVVFTSDDHCTMPYQLSTYLYNNTPVYRSTILFREYMDWHPKDPMMYKLFQEFLESEKPDLVHFHCVQRLSASILEATKDQCVPYFVTAHDAWWISDHQFLVDQNNNVYEQGHPEKYDTWLLPDRITKSESLERLAYFRELLESAKKILTVSENFADIYRLNGYPQTIVNKNGLSKLTKWKAKDTSYTNKVVCALIGGMSEHKGYFRLKAAIENSSLKNLEFLFVDHSKSESYIDVEYWNDVKITFIGRVKQQDIVSLYQRIDVLFAPSIWPESFGLVTREAAACGCWIVASNKGGIGEDVTDSNGHVISPNIEKIEEKIILIDNSPRKYKSLSSNSNFRPTKEQIRELVNIYNQ